MFLLSFSPLLVCLSFRFRLSFSLELVAPSWSIVLYVLLKRGMVESVTARLHNQCGRGFDSPYLLFIWFRFDHCIFRLGCCCRFPFELVAPRSCCCFDRTLGGWAWSFLSMVAPRSCCCFLGFRPPREAGAASMFPRAPEGVGQRFKSCVGTYVNHHRQYGLDDEGRCCAKASTLFSRNGGGERTSVIYVKEHHRRYKVDHLIVGA